jgi:hypothetical protein
MKEKLRNKIDFCGNKLNILDDFNENYLLHNIDDIYDLRK